MEKSREVIHRQKYSVDGGGVVGNVKSRKSKHNGIIRQAKRTGAQTEQDSAGFLRPRCIKNRQEGGFLIGDK